MLVDKKFTIHVLILLSLSTRTVHATLPLPLSLSLHSWASYLFRERKTHRLRERDAQLNKKNNVSTATTTPPQTINGHVSTHSIPTTTSNSASHHQCPYPAAADYSSAAMSAHYCDDELDDDVSRSDAAASSSPPPPPRDDEPSFIAQMLDSEPHHMPHPDYIRLCQNRSIHLTSRQDSINSILKVHAHFEFKPVTAFLSINYFDRFLAAYTLPETGWTFQLLSVACLSLAAKMEELYVPWLLDLQILERAYVFEPKTIQRMELLVLATLQWRLLSVTPFDYLHYFISVLPSSATAPDFVSVASDIILNTTRVIDFMRFPPSVIAAGAVISAAGAGAADLPDTVDERINREMVRSCHQLMEEYLLDTCPSEGLKVVSVEPLAPPSPLGVLDAAACASCDTHSENPASVSGSSRAEPENKRPRFSAPDVQESYL